MNSKRIANLVCSATEEKKGLEPLLLDLRRMTDIADYFVIVHGASDRHVRAIAESVIDRLGQKRVRPAHVEGLQDATWVLVDYGSVIVHVFREASRKFYNMERLWGDAKLLRPKRKHEKPRQKTRRSNPPRHSHRT